MASASPAVSVVVPVYNRGRLVTEALRSALAQTFGDFELIVVDDGSTEDLRTVLAGIGDERLRCVRHAANRGAAAARNTGAGAARGRYLAFLDSDDSWLPAKLARQLDWLRQAPAGVRLCCTGYMVVGPGNGAARVRQPSIVRDSYGTLLWGCNLSPGSTMLVERACFEEVGRFDEDLRRLEDWDWLLRYAETYEIGILPAVLAVVRAVGVPDGNELRASLDRIEAKHGPRVAARGRKADRILRSTLALERAAQSYREGKVFDAIIGVLASLACYPWRNLAFFRKMAAHLWSLLWPRR